MVLYWSTLCWYNDHKKNMTDPLWGESIGHWWISLTNRPVMWKHGISFDIHLGKWWTNTQEAGESGCLDAHLTSLYFFWCDKKPYEFEAFSRSGYWRSRHVYSGFNSTASRAQSAAESSRPYGAKVYLIKYDHGFVVLCFSVVNS